MLQVASGEGVTHRSCVYISALCSKKDRLSHKNGYPVFVVFSELKSIYTSTRSNRVMMPSRFSVFLPLCVTSNASIFWLSNSASAS